MRQIDFRTVYARLGDHPGSIGPRAASIVFQKAMAFPAGAVFSEVGSEGGRTTIILGHAAKNVGAKVYAYGDWQSPDVHPDAHRWFLRGIDSHGLSQVVTVSGAGNSVDMLVINKEIESTERFLGDVKQGGLCILLETDREMTDEFKMVEHEPQIPLRVYERL